MSLLCRKLVLSASLRSQILQQMARLPSFPYNIVMTCIFHDKYEHCIDVNSCPHILVLYLSLLCFLDRETLTSLEILFVMHDYLHITWYRRHSTYMCWLIILCQGWMKLKCSFWLLGMCQLPPVFLAMNWSSLWQSGSKNEWDALWNSELHAALSPEGR